MKLGKALKIAAAYASPKADPGSATRYVRVSPPVWGRSPTWVPALRKGGAEFEPRQGFWIPDRRGFVSAFDGRIGVFMLLDYDVAHVPRDCAVDVVDLKRALGAAKDGIDAVMFQGTTAVFLHYGEVAMQALGCAGDRIPLPPIPDKFYPYADVDVFGALAHAASKDETDRPSLCGVRLVGERAEAADETRIAVADVAPSPLAAPVVFPRALFKALARSKLTPGVAIAHGLVYVSTGEEVRFSVAEDRNFPLPDRPDHFDFTVPLPRARAANAAKFACQMSPEDVCEVATKGNLVRIAGCVPGKYTSMEEFVVNADLPQSTRFVRGRLLHEALVALDEHETVYLCYSPSPLQPVCIRAGRVSETIWPLEFPEQQAPKEGVRT